MLNLSEFINPFSPWLLKKQTPLFYLCIMLCGSLFGQIYDFCCGIQDLLVVACGIQFSDQGSNLCPLHWEHRVLATGPTGKSHLNDF